MKRASVVGLLFLFQGCALLSKAEVPIRRYYSPDISPSEAVSSPPAAHSACELRLGRVRAGAAIAERIMFRETEQEVGYYDDRLWTEKPDSYLRRGLQRTLFEELGLTSVMRGTGPTLDVELLTFEEVKAPQHLGRVRLRFLLSDEGIVTLQQTVAVDRPVVADKTHEEGSAVAEAMGQALHDAIHELAGKVVQDLARTETSTPACSLASTP